MSCIQYLSEKVLKGRTDSHTCSMAGGIPKPSKWRNSLYTLLAKGLAGFVPEGSWTYFGPSLFLHKGIHDDVGTAKRSFQEETCQHRTRIWIRYTSSGAQPLAICISRTSTSTMNTKPCVCVLQFIELYFCLEATFDIHFFLHKANLFVLAISVGSICLLPGTWNHIQVSSSQEPGHGGESHLAAAEVTMAVAPVTREDLHPVDLADLAIVVHHRTMAFMAPATWQLQLLYLGFINY